MYHCCIAPTLLLVRYMVYASYILLLCVDISYSLFYVTVVNCGDLEDPTNGTVVFTSTLYKSVANYSCNTGYNLTGDNSRTCLNSGEWSGSQPNCSGE